jgi:ketosteroid isomerase-like protein
MRARICFGSIFVPLAVLGCQPRAPQFTPQDEAAVRGAFDSALQHVRSGDWTAWAAGFSDGAILQPPNGPSVTGRAALEAWGRAFPAIESVTWPNVQVHGEGNMAYGTSAYVLKLKDFPADRGKQLAVLMRSAGGKWEVVAVSFNSDVSLPAPARRNK